MGKKYFSGSASYYTVKKRGEKIPMHSRDSWQDSKRQKKPAEHKKYEGSVCNRHSCNEQNGLKKCHYCGEYYCKSHIHAKPPTMPEYRGTSVEAQLLMEEWRKPYGHPCPSFVEYWDRVREQKIAEYGRALDRAAGRDNKYHSYTYKESYNRSESNIIEKIDRLKEKFGSKKHSKKQLKIPIKTTAIALVVILLLLVAIFVLPNLSLFGGQIKTAKLNMYNLASEKPLKVGVRIDYELAFPAKEVYLLRQDGSKAAFLDCKIGSCSQKIDLPIANNFKITQDSNSTYSYVIQNRTFALCTESENFFNPQSCQTLDLEGTTFRSRETGFFDSSLLTCLDGYKKEGSACVLIQRCSDGTIYNDCSTTKPNYCQDGNIVSKASVCGCPLEQDKNDEECIPIYMKGPLQRELTYVVRGKTDKISFTVYQGLTDYLAAQPRTYYCNPVCPTDTELELRFLNEEKQKKELDKLVEAIKSKTSAPDDQVRIAVSLVQKIPYDWQGFKTGILTGRYPYEVLFDNMGVCGEKSKLLAYLLRGLGYGVALFSYPDHEAVGIICPAQYNYKNSGYCFIETTTPTIITDSEGDYLGVGKLSDPSDIYAINEGQSFDSVSEEFNDAQKWNQIYAMGSVLSEYYYAQRQALVNKYGIKFD